MCPQRKLQTGTNNGHISDSYDYDIERSAVLVVIATFIFNH